MMRKKLICIALIVGIQLSVIFPFSIGIASGGEIIGQEKAGGYFYVVKKEISSFEWEIGYRNSHSIIKEDKNNKLDLEKFHKIVNEISRQRFKLLLSVLYLSILLSALLFVFKKKTKESKKGGVIFISGLLTITTYIILKTSIELYISCQEAKFLYLVLTQ
ncbi:hypothetical protein [Robertmurraya sp.]|uniref:hypothetical protein n=1 Tax=Robertmurraya sp. TaxID=2837525 RepID=UPI003703E524